MYCVQKARITKEVGEAQRKAAEKEEAKCSTGEKTESSAVAN